MAIATRLPSASSTLHVVTAIVRPRCSTVERATRSRPSGVTGRRKLILRSSVPTSARRQGGQHRGVDRLIGEGREDPTVEGAEAGAEPERGRHRERHARLGHLDEPQAEQRAARRGRTLFLLPELDEVQPARLVPDGLRNDLALDGTKVGVGAVEHGLRHRRNSSRGSGGSKGRGSRTHLEVANARRVPEASATRASDKPWRRPAWMSVPVATKRPLDGDAGPRKLIERSEDSRAMPFDSVVRTAPPRAASATNPSVPPAKTPTAVCHQALAGIDHVDVPTAASSTTKPLRCVSGGAGNFLSMKSRSWSTPGMANNPGCSRYAKDPLTGSSTIKRRGQRPSGC